ncbi:hypothetical protein [Mycobacteroides abscessus]|uniref:hypothetical protein n=1 Tax=Mycobacteroides abscessus TaxID=36809 RepID=UPI0012FFFA49|nr:hypothetical protein [Mycobacteroides abscessus]
MADTIQVDKIKAIRIRDYLGYLSRTMTRENANSHMVNNEAPTVQALADYLTELLNKEK